MGGGGEGIPLSRFLGTVHIAYDEWGPQSRVMQAEALVWAEGGGAGGQLPVCAGDAERLWRPH